MERDDALGKASDENHDRYGYAGWPQGRGHKDPPNPHGAEKNKAQKMATDDAATARRQARSNRSGCSIAGGR